MDYRAAPFSDMKIIDEEFEEIYEKCREYTVSSKVSLYATYKAIKYIIKQE